LSGSITLHRNTIWVNKKGRRFAEEQFNPFECANSLSRQPGKVSITLMDENIKTNIGKEVFGAGASSPDTKLDKMLQFHAAKGRVKIADTLDEIAKWAGIPARTLKATVRDYNNSCEKGRDELFNKEPANLTPIVYQPFYAIFCNPTILATHGGIKIDRTMAVLDKSADPILGLFSAGIDTGGVDADTYNYNLPGHSFGFAISTGRLAGKEAAKYAMKQ
jgi:fumarate reductase flavoprotein subunit